MTYLINEVKNAYQNLRRQLKPYLEGLYYLTWAAITNHHRQGGLNNRNLFLMVLEAGKSQIKVLVSAGSSLPSLGMATLALCPHMAKTEL